MVPGPSRWYGAPGQEIRARERSYAHPDVADAEISVTPPFERQRERGRDYIDIPVAEHFDVWTPENGGRGRDYFDIPIVEHLDMRRAHPESHGRVSVVPSHMERGRDRVFVAGGPERSSRGRERVNIERRRPRGDLYESVYEEESD